MISTNLAMRILYAKRYPGYNLKHKGWGQLAGIFTTRFLIKQEIHFSTIIADFDVVIMKHCFPASDVLEDIGRPNPSSPRQSLENYRAIYQLLRVTFNQNPHTLFIIWTLPPRHRLFEPSSGDKKANAARATEFSNWLKRDFLTEGGSCNNICVWDFREFVMDRDTNFLRYEYELSHASSDSHPNEAANSKAGPQFAQFVINSIIAFAGSSSLLRRPKIIFLCHSTGLGVYKYCDLGISPWFAKYNISNRTRNSMYAYWYPLSDNMPVNYYRLLA